MAQTDRQTNTQTDGHGDSKTNSAKRAELVKIYIYIYIGPMIRIGREIQCLPYAGFFQHKFLLVDLLNSAVVGSI